MDHLMPYTQEFWTPSPMEAAAVRTGARVENATLRESWNAIVDEALAEGRRSSGLRIRASSRPESLACTRSIWVSCWPRCSRWRAHPEAVW